MSSSKPTFVFVPGAWYGGSYFKPLKAVLSSPPYSYDFVSVSLPTILTPLSDSTWSTVQETFENDVNVIREKIDSVIDTGSNVVLVMHSWGGIPSTETMKYFKNGGYSDSKGREGKGKIVRMVWVASFPLLEGVSCAVAMGGKDLDWWDVNHETKTMIPINPKDIFFNDITPEAAAPLIAGLCPYSYNAIYSKITYTPFTSIPSTYVICENDQAIPLAVQEGMIEAVKASIGEKGEGEIVPFDVVERLFAGHTPFASHPEALAEILDRVAIGGK